jgi:hypothetical protein
VAIYASQYKDQPAITLESDQITAQFLPSIGSKMSSLIYKPHNLELMVQNPSEKYLLKPYDGKYEDAECSGFDEMFPTIDQCYYESYPWQGTKIPDHGEVWSLGWEQRIEGEALHMSTYGVRFPYKLEKRVAFAAPHILRTDYTLTNLSDFDFDFMWAAHTMINIEEDVELVLPSDVKSVLTRVSRGGAMGDFGDEHPWSQITQADGTPRDLSRLRPPSARSFDKYYVKGKMPAGWCALRYHRSNFSMALSFPVQTVPYLSVLPNEGGWRDMYNIFLEPSTATFDRVDVARLRNECSTVRAHAVYRWHLNISFQSGTDFADVNEAGVFG